MASIACLLAGLETFATSCQEQSKYLQVVKGVHGLHVYATEYWAEYLLSRAASSVGLDTTSSLFALACQLTENLELSNEASTTSVQNMIDERLEFIRSYPTLFSQVQQALKSRSVATLESEYLKEKGRHQYKCLWFIKLFIT